MHVLSAAQMREVDHLTITAHGIAGPELMLHAAQAVEKRLERDFPRALEGRIGIVCGGGNNGGDGLVLARLLAERHVDVLCLLCAPADRLRGDAAAALRLLPVKPVELTSAAAWTGQRAGLLGCDLIVDALFGTGLLRPLAGWLRQLVEELNRDYARPVLAVDIPSGLGADGEGPVETADAAVMRATATVTFTAPKRGLYFSRYAAAVGALTVAPIGSPEEVIAACGPHLRRTTPGDCRPFLAARPRDSHKGLYGHVLVIGGSLGKSGAVAMAATAALRTGAGLVTAAVPASVLPLVAAARPELMTEPLPETATGAANFHALSPEALDRLLHPATVLAVGPGLSQDPEAAALARHLIQHSKLPCVLDADGLNAFDGHLAELRPAHGVLTPHPGEMARLFGTSTADVQSRRLYYASRLAAETGAVAVLKGQFSLIADPSGNAFVNPTGNPGMATGGAGDVLTGVVAGLLAQFPAAPALELVAAAVYLHGRAGDAAAARTGEMGLLAGDITAALPAAIMETRSR
ncbi:MAG: NAD(P)H-hydrate dehydratase [Acidobacteria bacterium]|nr:MAG: NAD(P)H-hydrate dehydratase [Acidobacteriota bacterium]